MQVIESIRCVKAVRKDERASQSLELESREIPAFVPSILRRTYMAQLAKEMDISDSLSNKEFLIRFD